MRYKWSKFGGYQEAINPGPGRLFDADGREIFGPVCEVDTESGLVTKYVKDDQGRYLMSEDKRRVLREVLQYPPPLKFIPDDESLVNLPSAG